MGGTHRSASIKEPGPFAAVQAPTNARAIKNWPKFCASAAERGHRAEHGDPDAENPFSRVDVDEPRERNAKNEE